MTTESENGTPETGGNHTDLRKSAFHAPVQQGTGNVQNNNYYATHSLPRTLMAVAAVLAAAAASAAGAALWLFDGRAHTSIANPGSGSGASTASTLSEPSKPGPIVNLSAIEGFGQDCKGDKGAGWVYPPGTITATTPPGGGPSRNGHTWDQDPAAFSAVPAGPVQLQVTLTGHSGNTIVLNGLRLHVISRKQASGTVEVNVPEAISQCGGGTSGGVGSAPEEAIAHAEAADLDAVPPYWQAKPSTQSADRTDQLRFPLHLTADHPVELILNVTAEHCDCTWQGEIDWIEGSKSGRTLLLDNGRPFRTAGTAGLTQVDWNYSSTSPKTGGPP